MTKRIIALVFIAALLAAALIYSQHRPEPLKVSGFIEADEIRLGSRVGGRVQKVLAEEGQAVKAGDKLVELAPFDLLEKQAEARSNLAARRAELRRLKAGPRKEEIAQARAREASAHAMVSLAELKADRINQMFQRSAATQDERDTAAHELTATRAQLEEQHQVVAELEAGSRAEDIAQAQAATEAADAALRVLDRQIEELTITAPVDGTIEALDLQPGDMVGPNAPVLSLLDNDALWVRAYVPENMLSVRVGQKLPVSVDSYPGVTFAGHVSFVARQAEFTPGNVQTPEDRSKQVFRIKVTLDEGRDRLRPGMSADVWLDAISPLPFEKGEVKKASRE